MIDSATFLVDDSDVPAIRNILSHLASIGYCEKCVCERLGLSDLTELLWRALPIYREERLAARDALDLVIDIFLLQGVISTCELNQLFNIGDQEVLIHAGLLLIEEKKCFARASLYPVGESLIFSDHAWPKLPHPGCVEIPYDQVMYIGTDSRWLARTTVRLTIGSALDLCSGSGIHAILAAKHAQRVVAVDINPRAIQCIRFNAKASGLSNIEIKVGDLFEPVREECFDLITANPPFVPSPVESISYRDGGNTGEEVLRRIVAGLPSHLAPGGIAQIITELGEREHEPLDRRLREWLDGAAMDILILRIREHSAPSFAIGHADNDDNYDTFLSSVHNWSNNLRNQGYTRIVSVLLTFKWSDPTLGEPWTRIEESQPPHSNASTEIEAILLAEYMACKPNLYEMLEVSRMCRAVPIGMMESIVLGSELSPNVQAKLLGKNLSILKLINPVEREVLLLMEKPMTLLELLTITKELNLFDDDVFKAVVMLLRNGFLLLT
jgi:SAM-dependent methyltransferase